MVTEMIEPTHLKNENPTPEATIEKSKGPGRTPANPLSKNQIKKQKKFAEYAIKRKERRVIEREKQKEKRRVARSLGLPICSGPTRKELKKRQENFNENNASIKIAIDLDFDDDHLMSEHDIAKCVKQCLRVYTVNRRSANPGQLHLTGIKLDGRIHNSFKRNDGWENWKINYHFNETHKDLFGTEKLVYLTSESDTVLEKIEKDFVYVIGGIVDHNHHKNLCHERALKDGLKTARLPLSEHVDMKTRMVLSTFHVFELLLRVAGGSSWTDAILATIPVRKGAKPKDEETDNEHENSCEDEKQNNVIESCHIKTKVDIP